MIVPMQGPAKGPAAPGSGSPGSQALGSRVEGWEEARVCLEHGLYHSVHPAWRLGVIIGQYSRQLVVVVGPGGYRGSEWVQQYPLD